MPDPNKRPRILLVSRSFVQDHNNGKLLIIKRASTDNRNPNLWECPGGKLDEGQDLAGAQKREVFEETGLIVETTFPLVFADSRIIEDGDYKGLPYVVLFSITKVVGGTLTLSSEHSEYAWATYGAMLSQYDLTYEVIKAALVLHEHFATAIADISAQSGRGVVYDCGKVFTVEHEKPYKPEPAGHTNLDMWMSGTGSCKIVKAGYYPYDKAYNALREEIEKLKKGIR